MSSDIFVAESSPEEALVGPLHTITYVTSNPDAVVNMLTNGIQLTASDWTDLSEKQAEYLGFEASDRLKACKLYRDDEGANLEIRLIATEKSSDQVRPEVDGSYVGGLSIGFPMKQTDERERHMTSLGYPSVVGVKRLEFSSPSGETYVSEEVHFPGPENIYILGVNRPEIFVPVGPLNEEVAIGAPAYSAQCVSDSEATMAFYSDVLGYEIRRDMSMSVGNNSGLRLREGSDERFIQAFAPGANTGYLVFLDHGDDRKIANPGRTLGPPCQGVTMWSFPSNDLTAVKANAVAANAKIIKDIGDVDSPFIGKTRTLIIADPGGYPVEIYEE